MAVAAATPTLASHALHATAVASDALLFKGEYAWVYWLCLAGYCAALCRALHQRDPAMRWHSALPLLCLTGFGGGILVPITLGKPMVLHANESVVPVMCATWLLVAGLPGLYPLLLRPSFTFLANVCYEIFRFHVLNNCAGLAASSLPAPSMYPVPVVGPLIAGLLGGCGGGFMPLSTGLAPLEKGVPWRVQSAAIGSMWLHLALRDPHAAPALAAFAPPLADPDVVRVIGILFFVLVPLLSCARHAEHAPNAARARATRPRPARGAHAARVRQTATPATSRSAPIRSRSRRPRARRARRSERFARLETGHGRARGRANPGSDEMSHCREPISNVDSWGSLPYLFRGRR